MASVKVSELSPELLERLGYAAASTRQKRQTNSASVWAGQVLSKIDLPRFKQVEKQMTLKCRDIIENNRSLRFLFAPGVALVLAAALLFLYLLYCYCNSLICRKAGGRPGLLIWVPVLQIFPMLRAAGMSGWWFLVFCLPVLNLLAQIVYSFKIVQARSKSVWVAVLLLLPVTSLFAFVYLAFSSGPASEENPRVVEIMTLDAA
jgi:hypothetical protein